MGICDGCIKSFQCSGKRLLQCDECSKCQKFRCGLPWKRKCRKCGKRCCGNHTSGTLDSDTAVLEYGKTVCVDCEEAIRRDTLYKVGEAVEVMDTDGKWYSATIKAWDWPESPDEYRNVHAIY